MKTRPGTWDSRILQKTLVENEYNLPDDMTGMTVVDIGAHIGGFAAACHARNAKRVICYEPDPANYQILKINISELVSDVCTFELYNRAVTGIPATDLKIRKLRNHDFNSGENTGHIDVFGVQENYGIFSVSINKALQAIDSVDLLKMDCEGAEWGILAEGKFTNVKKIVMEFHCITSGEHPVIADYRDKNLPQLLQPALRTLCEKGFKPVINSITNGSVGMLTAEKIQFVPASKKLLWIGHASLTSGYSKVTENICKRLLEVGWDVRVFGLGYMGDPHSLPFPIYPGTQSEERLKMVVTRFNPDAIVILDDHWNIALYTQTLAALNIHIPIIGYVAVDSENVRKDTAAQFRSLKHAIFHTQFGLDELRKVGYQGPASIAGHGVDTTLFQPYDKSDAREQMQIGISKEKLRDAFIWGVVAMNQPRKRLDLSLAFFAAWWKHNGNPTNAYIYLHSDPRGMYDIQQLAEYLGIRGRVLTTQGALPETHLPHMYSIFDAMIATSEGESWGMCNHEGMACGIPQIAVRCGGMPYWAKDAIYWVNPSHYAFTANRTNTKRWVASEVDFVSAMDAMYDSKALRDEYSVKGLELIKNMPTWDDIADHFDDVLRTTIQRSIDAKKLPDAVAEFA